MKVKFLGYVIFIAGCMLFSLYVRFPGETAARYIERSLSQIQPGLTLQIDTVHLCFPPGIKTDTVQVYYAGSPIATLNRFRSFVDVTTIFSNPFTASFKAGVFHGMLSGVLQASRENPRDVSIETQLKDVKLKNVSLFTPLSAGTLSGQVNGTLTLKFKQGRFLKNEGDLSVVDLALHFPDTLFSIETYSFFSGNLKFSMSEDHIIKIDDCSVKGRQIDFQSSGEIRVARIFQNSPLNINTKVVLHPLFLMNAGDSMPIDLSTADADNAVIYLRIGGTIQHPTMAMDPGAK